MEGWNIGMGKKRNVSSFGLKKQKGVMEGWKEMLGLRASGSQIRLTPKPDEPKQPK